MAEYDMSVSRSNKQPQVVKIYEGRVTELFLLQQHAYNVGLESNQDRRIRMEGNDQLYRGEIAELFPKEDSLPSVMYIENKFKNALHDHARLASEGRGMPRFVPRGDKSADKTGARVRESIASTYWTVGGGLTLNRRLFLDLAGSGFMAVAGFYNKQSVYPQYMRLDPRFCYPDVRNGKLQSLVYIETVKERMVAHDHPELGLDSAADNSSELDFIAYYDDEEVAEAFVRRASKANTSPSIYVLQRWRHGLERVPVAYYQFATFDGAPRGIFDQLSGPMMVRNKSVRFVIDYMEQIAHSPLFALNVENANEVPGPMTVYRGDPDAEPGTVRLERVGPAAAGGSLWNLLSYMGDQEEKEATQPAARSGQVPQSQASGSFVNSTQGTLTSVVIEMQEGMGDLRQQLDTVLFLIDEQHLDTAKPLVKPVGKKRTYMPSKDIDGWYYHTVEYGAGAGLDKLNTDNRVLNHVAGRLIDRGTAREQIDYLDDSNSIQEKIDAENIGDALLQRFAVDPSTPLSSLAKISVIMEEEGLSKTEALKVVAPELFAAEQAAQPQQPMQPGMEDGGPGGPGPAEDMQPPTAEGALPAEGAGETPVPTLPSAPMQQLFGPVR